MDRLVLRLIIHFSMGFRLFLRPPFPAKKGFHILTVSHVIQTYQRIFLHYPVRIAFLIWHFAQKRLSWHLCWGKQSRRFTLHLFASGISHGGWGSISMSFAKLVGRDAACDCTFQLWADDASAAFWVSFFYL